MATPNAKGTGVTERMVHADGVDICTESFGDPSDPAILLVMGAQTSLVHWPEEFCRTLAEAGRFVIRYDNRDTGKSTTYPLGEPGYVLRDMVADAVTVLDAYGIEQADVLGWSMGGMIAQILALDHPSRVRSLTLYATSPHGPEDEDLPDMPPEIVEQFAQAQVDWDDREAVTEWLLECGRIVTGSTHPFDEAFARAQLEVDLARSVNLPSRINHALMDVGDRWRERLGDIKAPTLVIHGTDDVILPLGHGEALAKAIPGARLLTLVGVGHELPPAIFSLMTEAILDHTANVS